MKKRNLTKPVCPVDYAFQRIGGKYKGRILWNINEHGMLRYGELSRQISGITTKMLTQTLKELENDNLIIRTAYPEIPPRVEYCLTPAATKLIPFINHLREWANEQLEEYEPDSIIHPVNRDSLQ